MGIEHGAVLFISTVIFLQPLRQFFDRGVNDSAEFVHKPRRLMHLAINHALPLHRAYSPNSIL